MPILKSAQLTMCKASIPGRSNDGTIIFKDAPEFQPNLTPKEVLHLGSFGGGYFRKVYSQVSKKEHDREWETTMPRDWWEGLNIETHVASQIYRPEVNQYKVRCGVTMGKNDPFGLLAWESKGWIDEDDPFGWFQWYCKFYQGRRSTDDERQIGRWTSICGPKGRWKNNLVARCVKAGAAYDDASVAPVVRQTLQHWAYRLTQSDFEDYSALVREGASTAFLGQVYVGAEPHQNSGASEQDADTAAPNADTDSSQEGSKTRKGKKKKMGTDGEDGDGSAGSSKAGSGRDAKRRRGPGSAGGSAAVESSRRKA